MYGTGISKIGDLLDLAVEEKIINKAGAWFSYGEDKIGQGRENSKVYLEQNPKLVEEIKNKLLVKHGLMEGAKEAPGTADEMIDQETGEIIEKPKKTRGKKIQ